jgi:NAD(P)-dependent dehydrogenase (short-subunit alcohol dehydrogenase family)
MPHSVPQPETALIIGAGSHIGSAAMDLLRTQFPAARIIAISRHGSALPQDPQVQTLHSDYSESSMQACVTSLQALQGCIHRVIICHGILHTADIAPEKRLEDLHAASMAEVLRVNTILPALWLSALLPLLKGSQPCVLAVLSARVGSIADNRKGGWYSYRASKAALNMLLKSAAIEYARRAPNVKLLAFHPGTVNTPLSAPFQRNVAESHLFTPAQAAHNLLARMASLPPDGTASFLDHAGKPIEW